MSETTTPDVCRVGGNHKYEPTGREAKDGREIWECVQCHDSKIIPDGDAND